MVVCGPSGDTESLFEQDEVRKTTVPFQLKQEELDDPYRIIKVDLCSLLNSNLEPMTLSQICRNYSELFCDELSKTARKMGLSLSELFEAVSDVVKPVKGSDGETLYTALQSDKTKDIRSQIVQQSRGVKKQYRRGFSPYGFASQLPSNFKSQAAVPVQSQPLPINHNVKKPGTISISSLKGGPKSDERCSIIVKMIRDNGTFHQNSGRIRMRIGTLAEVYWETLSKLPLWGSTMTEKEYAYNMGSNQYAKYWQISSEKNYNSRELDDKFIYFIDTAPEGQESVFTHSEARFMFPSPSDEPTISAGAKRLIRNCLPLSETSLLTCDMLPETRADLNSRQRDPSLLGSRTDCRVYSKDALYKFSSRCDVTDMVLTVWKLFPALKPRSRISARTSQRTVSSNSAIHPSLPISSSNDTNIDRSRGRANASTTGRRTAVVTDVQWFIEAPCLLDTHKCTYFSGAPLWFLPPSSILFGLRNGNENSERVNAINSLLQTYYETKEWSAVECKAGVPCIARHCEDGIFSYVRAIIVKADVDRSFECVCLDISACVSVDAADIGPLPECFSVNLLPSSLFVARIRGIAAMTADSQVRLQNHVRGYFEKSDDLVAGPLPSAVFGRVGQDCVVDWIDPVCHQWMSNILLAQPHVRSAPDDLPNLQVEDAFHAVQKMEANGEFDFSKLEWCSGTAGSSCVTRDVEKSSLPINENSIKCFISDDRDSEFYSPVDVNIDEIPQESRKEEQKHGEPVFQLCDAVENDNSLNFLALFKDMCSSDNNVGKDLFIATSLAFASSARMMMPTERWEVVLDEIKIHF